MSGVFWELAKIMEVRMCPGTVAYRLIDGVTEKDLWKICW